MNTKRAMSKPPKNTCVQCSWADGKSGHLPFGQYLCKRHAPIAVHDITKHCGVNQEAFVPRWPVVSHDNWCGDFKPMKVSIPPNPVDN
jgi:hypothetical protein